MISGELRELALATTGFMPPEEGDALHVAALEAGTACPGSPFVEVGSYCGRSTLWLADAARRSRTVVFAVDHHHGSEENQEGWEWHDPSLVDPETGRMDTLMRFRRTIVAAGMDDVVIAVVGQSPSVAKYWSTPLALLFIDGGHGVEPARQDYLGWTPHVARGGVLAIHDVFTDPAQGGQAPYDEIFRPALESGLFALESTCGSLRVLRRL